MENNKFSVGMYVRTKNGLISKIQGINEYSIALKNTCCERLRDKYFTFPNEEKIYEITKSSFNLIDLIEVGDYVNGWLVNEIWEDKIDLGDKNFACAHKFNFDKHYVWKDEIKEVLTHEQYSANVYKVGE